MGAGKRSISNMTRNFQARQRQGRPEGINKKPLTVHRGMTSFEAQELRDIRTETTTAFSRAAGLSEDL